MKVLWTGTNPDIKVLQDKEGGLRFRYSVNQEGDTCEFSLFSEVGEPYKRLFKGFFNVVKLSMDLVEYPGAPYFANKIDTTKPKFWFAVVGRIQFDDDDTCMVFRRATEEEAFQAFRKKIWDDRRKEVKPRERRPSEWRERLVIVNHILVSATKINKSKL